jgi:hypothetical protein
VAPQQQVELFRKYYYWFVVTFGKFCFSKYWKMLKKKTEI